MYKNLIIFLAISTAPVFAGSEWIKMLPEESSCQRSCSRVGLENVLIGTEGSRASICAAKIDQQWLPGTQQSRQRACKVLDSERTDEIKCYCATDGVDKGSDYSWIKKPEKNPDCSQACSESSYKYALYMTRHDGVWLQVCASKEFKVGIASSKHLCSANRSSDYGCLCTKTYAGDLDPRFDP